MNKLFLPAIIVLIALLSDCRPKEKVAPITTEDLRIAANVKTGSYFIYRDSASGKMDSFYSYYYRSGESAVSTGSNHSLREQEDYNMRDGMNLPYHSFHFSAFNDVLSCEFSTTFMDGTFEHDSSYFVVQKFPFPGEGIILNNSLGQSTAIDNHPSYEIAGKSYQNVHEYLSTTSAMLYSIPTYDTINLRTFYSVQSGLVKYCTTRKTSYHAWELVKSNLIR